MSPQSPVGPCRLGPAYQSLWDYWLSDGTAQIVAARAARVKFRVETKAELDWAAQTKEHRCLSKTQRNYLPSAARDRLWTPPKKQGSSVTVTPRSFHSSQPALHKRFEMVARMRYKGMQTEEGRCRPLRSSSTGGGGTQYDLSNDPRSPTHEGELRIRMIHEPLSLLTSCSYRFGITSDAPLCGTPSRSHRLSSSGSRLERADQSKSLTAFLKDSSNRSVLSMYSSCVLERRRT